MEKIHQTIIAVHRRLQRRNGAESENCESRVLPQQVADKHQRVSCRLLVRCHRWLQRLQEDSDISTQHGEQTKSDLTCTLTMIINSGINLNGGWPVLTGVAWQIAESPSLSTCAQQWQQHSSNMGISINSSSQHHQHQAIELLQLQHRIDRITINCDQPIC